MNKTSRPKIETRIVFLVAYIAVTFIAIGAVLSFWSGREMRETVKAQFNQEQLLVARSVKNLIERQLDFLAKELLLVSRNMGAKAVALDTASMHQDIKNVFARVLECGVRKIEIADLNSQTTHTYVPYRQWTKKKRQLTSRSTCLLSHSPKIRPSGFRDRVSNHRKSA